MNIYEVPLDIRDMLTALRNTRRSIRLLQEKERALKRECEQMFEQTLPDESMESVLETIDD